LVISFLFLSAGEEKVKCPRCRLKLEELGFDELFRDQLFYCSSCRRYFTKKYLEEVSMKESFEIPSELLPRQFLKSTDVNDGETLEITEVPTIRPAEQSKFGKMSLLIPVKLPDGSIRIYQPNKTTIGEFVKAWSKDMKAWVGKKFVIEIQKQRVSGQLKEVIYGVPEEGAKA
jgi:hypothetical protein